MSHPFQKITEKDYLTTAWSGGTTTQIAISPADAVYADRDFLWRVSSAEVALETSDFTPLPDYRRLISTLRGEIILTHNDSAPVTLRPFEVHVFDGADRTRSTGRCTDFNLMLRKGQADGRMDAVPLPEKERLIADPRCEQQLIYCAAGCCLVKADGILPSEAGEGFRLLAGQTLLRNGPCTLEVRPEAPGTVLMFCQMWRTQPEDEDLTKKTTKDETTMEMKKFCDMPYVRPDVEELKAAYETAISALNNAATYAEARKAFFDLQEKDEAVGTMFSICSVRNTIDTTDEYYDAEIAALRKAFASMIPLRKRYDEALANSPFRPEFEKELGKQLFRMVDASLKTSDERIIPDVIREGELKQQYQKDSAVAATEFRGEKCNFYGLLKHMESTDRDERREAFHAWAKLYESISPKLDAQYDELVQLRDKMAKTLGYASYTDLAYLQRRRFDYTQADAAAFRDQVRRIITPAVAELREKQRQRLGIDKLRYYDESLKYPDGNAAPEGSVEELVAKAQKMYSEMSPETGECFDSMVKYGLFDLETRPGKRMGGYMTYFSGYKAPFIFSNFNGTSADVDVLTHEAGHAFEGYLAMRSIPVSDVRLSTSEINEVHSMSMEHFAYPWMESFFGEKSEKYITAHLFSSLATIPYLVSVDEFQHRVYAKPEMTALERRQVWREIERIYMPWRDYDGEPFLEQGGFWMQKQHIFLYPFYYIEYALAQLCAFQYYGRMKTDRRAAWEDYLRLCRAGGTKGYFELLEEGNLLNPFREGTVEASVGHVIEELRERY